ncbi:hypothetical protein [Streptomyces sp. H34-S4]|uniref:hypothetical protein n=1 Tax=Streptomyces sp. H34-S4 TaxID=2996463 RepID=UPI00227207A0|nr:hypothetical protein [Streptomyces sp. H34-S4]MCY0939688.1 hypothetical protein [Streptomyces sp. H34-S4]
MPIHIAVRLGEEFLYLGTAKVSRANTSDGVLTDSNVNGDRAAALEQFVTGWYLAAGAAESPSSCTTWP